MTYLACLLVGLGAMAWITRLAVRSEMAEVQAQHEAKVGELVRLALWRMDSTLSLFLSPEASRPYFHFQAFYPADQAYAPLQTRSHPGPIMVPSPMLISDDPLIRLRFQWDPQGTLTSPLVPPKAFRPMAEQVVSDPLRLQKAHALLGDIRKRLGRSEVVTLLQRQGTAYLTAAQMRDLQVRPQGKATSSRSGGARFDSPFQVNQGTWVPFWNQGDLFLARQVWVGDQEWIQACWLDWAAVQEVLLSTLREFLPRARLMPGEGLETREREFRMSSLPVQLIPGVVPRQARPLRASVRTALWFGWVCAWAGALAGAWVLHRTLVLGERRMAFTSAVTHELRTPLTTFRLYTELLANDMVPDPQERQELLRTLVQEADRLDHLVKNVLAFARLEARPQVSLARLTLSDLLQNLMRPLADRARQSGLRVELQAPPELASTGLWTDAQIVEQILLNLVDNACKYAGGASRPIRLEVDSDGAVFHFRVRDFGPGIPAAEHRRLFRPFEKLDNPVSRQAPGVGLGLALCKRLAVLLGGTLRVDETHTEGACFVLSLPAGSPASRP